MIPSLPTRASVFHRFFRRSAPVSVALAAIAFATGSCAPKAAGPGGFHMPPTAVEVADVHPQVVRDQFRALGSLEAEEIIDVVAEVNAIVKSLDFTEGQAVEHGQVLVELDDREYRADAERADAQQRQAQSEFERAKKLRETDAISDRDLEDAQTKLDVAKASAALTRARFDRTRIRAPWSGLIGTRRVSPGAYVRSGDAIAQLAHVDRMKVAFAAPERYLGELKRGVAIDLTSPAYPHETFHGAVTVVDPIIDPNTRTVRLVAEIPNPGLRLKPGMSANVTVTFAERALALVVPDEAVFAEGTQNYVFVVKPDSTVVRTAVELGTRDSSRVEIVKGLTAGVQVVRAGHQKLFDGAHVMPVTSQPDGSAPAGGVTAAATSDPPVAKAAAAKPAAAKPAPKSGARTQHKP